MWRMQDTQNNEKVPNPPEPLRATLAAFPSQNFSAARPRPEEVHQPGGAKNLGSQRCAWTLRKEVGKLPIPDALLLGSCQETFLRNTLEKNVNHCNTILCRTGAAPNTASEAHSDDKPETHMGHPPSVLVLAMLERLEAKLDHLQNSMEDVPSRVANLMERIWVEKGGVFLENGAGSLEAVSPAGIRDFTFTRSSPTSHPASPGDPSRSLQAVFSDNHEPVRGPGTQLMFSSEHELDEHLKQEPLSVGSWDPQVSHFMKPQSPEVHGPQKDQHRKLVLQTRLARQKDLSIQPGLPGGRDLNMLPVSPAGQDLQRDPCKEPVFPEGPGPQQHQSLQLVFPGGKDPGKHLKPEALSLGGSEWNQRQKTVRPGEQEADGPLQPEPWSGGGPQRNQCQQPVRPDAQEDGYKPAPPCINAQSPSVPTSCLRWDTLSAGGAALTDTLEGGSVTSDISPAIPGSVTVSCVPSLRETETEDLSPAADEDVEIKHDSGPPLGYGTMTNIISVVIKEEEEDIHPATYQGSEETQTTTHPTALQSEEGRVNGGETSTSTERKTFTHSFILNQEHDLQTPERRLTCSEWEKVYRTKIFLEAHQRPDRGIRHFACTDCEKRFTLKSDLVIHRRIHTGERPFQCTDCGKSFTQKGNLLNHQRTHTGVRPFHCTDCGKRFTEKGHLLRHQRIHTGVRPFKCTECEKSFRVSTALTQHQRIHTGVRPFSCTECGKSFTDKSALLRHEKIHKGIRPFQCTNCEKSFIDKSALLQHQRIHTGVRPFNCTECDKSFTVKPSLVQHLRIHRGVKPYKCTVCEKSFTLSTTLMQHQRTHTGERPFNCSECEKSFTAKQSLSRHLRLHTEKKDGVDVA